MDYQFLNSPCPCLKRVLGEVRSLEQAQEIRLTDGMPDIGRVLCGWGQILQRSKEWNGDCITLTAGMMVWVLYAPEDGSEPRFVEGWIPFNISWDLPEALPEGKMEIECLTRFVDARSVSARKIMVRAGISARAQAFIPWEAQVFSPPEEISGVELRRVKYPMKAAVEAGEKIFSMEEELNLPGTVPEMEKLILWTLTPEIQEQRVMTDKVVFKGCAHVHILYKGIEGKLHSWDFTLPFNQFSELSQPCSGEAEAEIGCAVTALELEQADGNTIHLRAGLTCQYLIEDQKLLELTEDAYCPGREVTVENQDLELGRILECRRETVTAECSIPGDGDLPVDTLFLPDYPRQRKLDGKVLQELSGMFQVLYYGSGGELQAAVSRWEDQKSVEIGEEAMLSAVPVSLSEPQILMGTGDARVRAEFSLLETAESEAGIPMVTAVRLGEGKEPDENRPSLIIRKAGDADLWTLAKASGSTVGAIKAANHLQSDPVPGQMLLIPIL